MYKLVIIFTALFFTSCSAQKIFVVRHAEKASEVTTGNPPLTKEGEAQAKDLLQMLHRSNVKHIYSTNLIRTLNTAEPLKNKLGLRVKIYDAKMIDDFVAELRAINDSNILVVSHSNVVDDIVNRLLGVHRLNDLDEKEYGVAYILKRKGNRYTLQKTIIPKVIPR